MKLHHCTAGMLSGMLIGFYLTTFTAAFFLISEWLRRCRNERTPFPENQKLLRGPGETLRNQLRDWEYRLYIRVVLVALLAGLLGFSVPLAAMRSASTLGTSLAIAAEALGIATIVWQLRVAFKAHTTARNQILGCFGERIVAEHLDVLKAEGYRVFHDLPCEGTRGRFNIDHVIVGPTGIFAIETKTRRKGRSRDGFAKHEIIYDGSVLAFPWGEDRHGLDQARRNAQWLEIWLSTLLHQEMHVKPVLVFPGWYVITRSPGDVFVLNPSMLPAVIRNEKGTSLGLREIQLISQQLDQRCRDVELV